MGSCVKPSYLMVDIIINGTKHSVQEDVASYVAELQERLSKSYRKELFTPERANQILAELAAHPDHNQRKCKPSVVTKYAKDMKNGNWLFCGDSIKFDVDGICSDGQQRLHAIIESGIPQEFILVNDLPRESMRVIDSGFKKSVEDYLKSAKAAYEIGASAIVKQVNILQRGGKSQGQSLTNVSLTNTDMIDLYDKDNSWYNKSAVYGAEISRISKALKKTEVGSIFYYLIRTVGVEEETVRRFFSVLAGADINSMTTHGKIVAELFQRDCKGSRRYSLYIKAWNAFITFSRKGLTDEFKNKDWFITPQEVENEVAKVKNSKTLEFATSALG